MFFPHFSKQSGKTFDKTDGNIQKNPRKKSLKKEAKRALKLPVRETGAPQKTLY
jgi:hypothetical protein